MEDNPQQLRISAEVQAGNSGGPLLDEHGDVVGMINSTLNPLTVLARTGGTLPQNVNFAVKSDAIERFLKMAGVELKPPDTGATTNRAFDQVKESVVLVRAGKVLPGEENRPELFCRFGYRYFWDMYWRFQAFYVEFVDGRSGKVILKAGQFGDNLSTENSTINETFKKIREQLFGKPAETQAHPIGGSD